MCATSKPSFIQRPAGLRHVAAGIVCVAVIVMVLCRGEVHHFCGQKVILKDLNYSLLNQYGAPVPTTCSKSQCEHGAPNAVL